MELNDKELELLEIIEHDSRIALETMAKMMGLSLEETAKLMEQLEEKKIIIQYNTVIDWRKVDGQEGVTAMIDVKVTPKRGVGFDEVAYRIQRFPEVRSLYLMSGAYDLSVVIEGKTMSQVANFVSQKLSTIDSVISTTTHFILKKYKHDGTVFEHGDDDKRIVVTP